MNLFKEKDKQLHMGAGALVAALAVASGYGIYALPAAALVGLAKEVYDKFTPGRVVDFYDFVATALPGLPVTLYFMVQHAS